MIQGYLPPARLPVFVALYLAGNVAVFFLGGCLLGHLLVRAVTG